MKIGRGGQAYELNTNSEETEIEPMGIVLNIGDRTCQKHTKCSCTEYESQAPTETTDRECRALTTCDDDQYESRYPTKHAIYQSMYVEDRRCSYFSDYVRIRDQAPSDRVRDLWDQGPSDTDECRPVDNQDNQCNDGGVCSAPCITGEVTCPWGSDPDCPSRQTVTRPSTGGLRTFTQAERRDDCLPFYHTHTTAEPWKGQFWNAATVRAHLPDAIMSTDPGASYFTLRHSAISEWAFAADVSRYSKETDLATILTAQDNFLRPEEDNHRVKISLKHIEGGHAAADAVVGDSINGVSNSEYICDSQRSESPSFPVFPVTATPPYIRLNDGIREGQYGGAITACADIEILDPNTGTSTPWRSTDGTECADLNTLLCKLDGNTIRSSRSAVTATDGCCVCGGGQRVSGVTLEVSAREVHNETFHETPVTIEHTEDVFYEPPEDDWCVAQRIDTARFTVYVFDNEAPELDVQEHFTVCNDDHDDPELAKNYATIRTEQPSDEAAAIRPNLYPRSVTDNVDASMSWDETDHFRPQGTEQHTPKCYSTTGEPDADWARDAPAYQNPPTITVTRQRHSSTTRVLVGANIDAPEYDRPVYLIGAWTVTFTAQDSFKNSRSKTVKVTVNDCSPPQIICTDQRTLTKPGVCFCTVSDWGHISAIDNSGVSPKVTVEDMTGNFIDHDYKFPIGTTR